GEPGDPTADHGYPTSITDHRFSLPRTATGRSGESALCRFLLGEVGVMTSSGVRSAGGLSGSHFRRYH
ncbi:hypothetical protein ACFWFQ_16470, partial [Nocardia salmonicida]|uniref:hypothetical protein n=1 Tax=Nocardia salmonicida TaxID=53431 RepID=UPI0036531A13